MARTSDILSKAVEALAERGRCTETTMDSDGKVCLVGALEVAAQELVTNSGDRSEVWDSEMLARYAVLRAMGLPAIHPNLPRIPLYNDDPSTSDEDCTLLLKRAAEAEREAGR